MSKENSITPDAILALDTGGEGTKFIYSLISGEAYSGFMEPEVIEIPQSSQEEFQNLKLSVAEPEDACWVGWNGQYHAVGYLAKTQFLANDRLAESKVEAASSKALAAIWVMAAKLKLKERFKLAVKLVLPPGEFAARETLQNKLLSQAKNFSTPSGKIFTEIVHFQCLPEGAGIYLNYLDANENALKRKTIAFVMLGHRNASVLVSRRGVLKEGLTSNLGFQQLVRSVQYRCSHQNSDRLTPSIARAGWEINLTELYPLAFSNSEPERAKEVEQIALAIQKSQPEYFNALQSWLINTIPFDTSEIVFCGGTADYLKPKLSEAFNRFDLTWHANTKIPRELDSYNLGFRLCDVYGLYRYLKLFTNNQTTVKSTGGRSE
ncbi:ParM/StbA family protein [Phormidium sp. LEGE 05292]|uniref:ParM/StbA family protein n=1 Tax=[Phormidium] sp. LEGE 05292 TaxID=767427 RepID=UPI001881BBC1|nr:ParM/StbA family protein [Phormidium sp. LEGE 05292]MBE9229008.1 ParM/StbA family protein [Phormidium sp. LEGE 05292]